MSNVSPGAAYFQDPDGFGHVYHRAGSFAPGRRPVADRDHLDIELGAAGDAVMTARFCHEVLVERRPALAVLWLSEPDHTGHHAPLGSPAHRAAIAAADRCVAQVLEVARGLRSAGDDVLLLVCSDHGMETTRRTIDLDALLVEAGLKSALDSTEVVVAPNGTAAVLYRASLAPASTEDLVRFCAAQDWAGRVLAGPELEAVGMTAGAPVACAVTLRTEDAANPFGVRGLGDIVRNPLEPTDYTGFGQHGGLGPNEQRPFLLAWGGGFPERSAVDAPVCHVDLAPTVLDHLGLLDEAATQEMDGRPLPARSAVGAE